MDLRIAIAAVHLLALGLGLGSCLARAYSLRNLRDTSGLNAVFFSDNLFGLAALLWITTGLWRAFGGLEKGTDYYLQSHAFWLKISLFLLVFLLELKPMVTLIQWRIKQKKGISPDLAVAPQLGTISFIEAGIMTLMVFVAVAMARGLWFELF